MATLYTSTKTARRVLLGVLLALLVILAVDTLLKVAATIPNPFQQTPSFYEQPSSFVSSNVPTDVLQMPSLEIASESSPSFTVEGAFPSFPDTVRFYRVEKPRQRLDTVPIAEAIARRLGFTAYSDLTAELMQWQDSRLTKTLNFNKVGQTWGLRTQYFQDVQALKPKTLDSDITTYEDKAVSFVNQLGFSNTTLSRGEAVAKYAKLGNDGLFTNPLLPAQADYVDVTIYRKFPMSVVIPAGQRPAALANMQAPSDYQGLVYSTDPRRGSFNFVASDKMTDLALDMYAFDFVDYDYNTSNYTVEYVLTAEQAWNAVRQGQGALTLLKPRGSDYFADSQKLTVTRFAVDASRTELAYWEPDEWTGFVYPIFIFRGRAELPDGKTADFVFYVDAFRRVDDPRT